jgi:hypothetical protein
MYALAASAAGVSLLALAPTTEAKIVYAPAHLNLQGNHPFPLDLNHDGKVDFFLLLAGSIGTGGTGVTALSACHRPFLGTKGDYICVSSTSAPNSQNAVRVTNTTQREAAVALRAGAIIKKGDLFRDKVAVGMGDVIWLTFSSTHTRWSGDWVNGGKGVRNRYLGLKFKIGPHESLHPRDNGHESEPPIVLIASASGCLRAMAIRPGKPRMNTAMARKAPTRARMTAKVK